MRSASEGDLTAKAVIREAALRLFAERGVDAVSVRSIAAAAEVSPALVLHHFGSKAGLREAVDAHAARTFEVVMEAGAQDELIDSIAGGDTSSIAAAFAEAFPPGSALPAYLRRLLLSGEPTGTELMRGWLAQTVRMLEQLEAAGVATPSESVQIRAAFLLANDLAVVLLRDPLCEILGFDPLSPEGIRRWGAEVMAVYAGGAWEGEPS